jgi:hypothetical protein
MTIEQMPLEDIREVEQIIKFTQAKSAEVSRMANFTTKYIDSKCQICPHCSSQVKFSHKRIINFYEKNATTISDRKQMLLNSVVEPEQNKCIVCSIVLDDKRKRYCSKKCKDDKTNTKAT